MKTVSIIGSLVVTCALVFYSIGFASEQKRKQVTSRVLLFFTLGVLFDISATTLMIIGSSNGMLTVHGFIGYSSLLLMVADTVLLWKHNRTHEREKEVSRELHLYSRVAYAWWVVAFITGGVLVAIRKIHG